jgi:hypothetical protein
VDAVADREPIPDLRGVTRKTCKVLGESVEARRGAIVAGRTRSSGFGAACLERCGALVLDRCAVVRFAGDEAGRARARLDGETFTRSEATPTQTAAVRQSPSSDRIPGGIILVSTCRLQRRGELSSRNTGARPSFFSG